MKNEIIVDIKSLDSYEFLGQLELKNIFGGDGPGGITTDQTGNPIEPNENTDG